MSFYLMLFGVVLALAAVAGISLASLKKNRKDSKDSSGTEEIDALRIELAQYKQQAQQQQQAAKQINDHNQAAILTLMNELQEVAGGDLTVQATVADGITGAIADSINYTLGELRTLMGRVISAADEVQRVVSAAQQTPDDSIQTIHELAPLAQELANAVSRFRVSEDR
jgi:twitching motility protein PilJ